AIAARFFNERPQVDVVAVDVCSPGDDVLGMPELLGLGAQLHAIDRLDPFTSGFGANVPRQLRSAQAMKEPPVHARAVQFTQCSAIRVREDTFAAEFGGNGLQSGSDFVEGFIPRNAFKCWRRNSLRGSDIPVRAGV